MEPPKPKDAQKEIEIALGELEERVDRLRSAYEQYFMGFEKIEPTVQRKDVDRRFVALRKQQIRNTALRFRFNVVTQKFNTYSMYWTRICRQIEEGTYKRHVAKATRRFGSIAPGAGARAAAGEDLAIDVELGDFEDLDFDAALAKANADAEAFADAKDSFDTIRPAIAASAQAPAPRPAPQVRPPAPSRPELDPFDDDASESTVFAPGGRVVAPARPGGLPRTGPVVAPHAGARPAAPAAGARPVAIRRSRPDVEPGFPTAEPGSDSAVRTAAAARPALGSSPDRPRAYTPVAAPGSASRIARPGAGGPPLVRPRAGSDPNLPPAAASEPRLPAPVPGAPSQAQPRPDGAPRPAGPAAPAVKKP